MSEPFCARLLAAGFSSRNPGKLLTPVGGVPAVVRSVLTLREAGMDPVVVLGHGAASVRDTVERHLDPVPEFVISEEYHRGMAFSIRAGVLSCQEGAEPFLLHLADKPFVTAKTVEALIENWDPRNHDIVVPVFQGQRGHPVLFSAKLRGELLALEGDVGARSVLERHAERVNRLAVSDEGVVLDLDRILGMSHA